MVLSEAIAEYRTYARHEIGHARTTLHSYLSWQRNFANWLAEHGLPDPPVREITGNLVRRYSYSLSGRGVRPRTIRGALHAIRALFGYLVEMGALTANPALEVRLPKVDAAIRLIVSDDDLIKLLEATDRQRTDFHCVRDRAVLSVLIFCGLRRSELLDLRVSSINLEEEALLVQQGKGGKSRTVYLCPEALEALREWLALRLQCKSSHDYLFVHKGGKRFGERSLAHMLEQVKAIAGFKGDPRIKPHSIRHAAATRLLRNGADIRSIQAWLGHSQLTTTAMYLHTDEQQVRKIAPLAGFRKEEPKPDPPSAPKEPADERRRLRFRAVQAARQRGRSAG